jgi:hypothetical protein
LITEITSILLYSTEGYLLISFENISIRIVKPKWAGDRTEENYKEVQSYCSSAKSARVRGLLVFDFALSWKKLSFKNTERI